MSNEVSGINDGLIDEDDELIEELDLRVKDSFTPTEQQRAGGASVGLALTLIIFGIIGILASFQLVMAELTILKNPAASLSCDFNPLVGCSASVLSWQAHVLFGIPNSVIGVGVYGVVAAVGGTFLAGARLARWFWRLMVAAVLGGFAFIAWFLSQSITVFGTLCPWCMVCWATVLIMGWQVIGAAARGGHLGSGSFVRTLYLDRVWFTVGSFLLILIVVIFGFWAKWPLVF